MNEVERGFDCLFAGSFPLVTEFVIIDVGQTLDRGSLLGKVAATGKYKLSEATAADGSEVPVAILADSVDTTNDEKQSTVYLSGEFVADHVVFGTGHTAESTKDSLRTLGIYLK
jgi:hypothetical protein